MKKKAILIIVLIIIIIVVSWISISRIITLSKYNYIDTYDDMMITNDNYSDINNYLKSTDKIYICFNTDSNKLCMKNKIVKIIDSKEKINNIINIIINQDYNYNGMYNYDQELLNYKLFLIDDNIIKGIIYYTKTKLILSINNSSFVYNNINNKIIGKELGVLI